MLRQSRILVSLNITAAIVCVAYGIYHIYHEELYMALCFGVAVLIFTGNCWLIQKKHKAISAVLSILVCDFLLLIFDTGYSNNIHNAVILYIPILLFAYSAIDYRYRFHRLALLTFTILCILLINFTDLTPKLMNHYHTPKEDPYIAALNTVVAIIVSLVLIKTIISANYKTEQQLLAAKETAELSSQEKLRFLSIMSHEIRTPANAIVGLSYLLHEKEIPDNIRRDIDLLHYSAQNLKSLIDNIIYFNKLQTNDVTIEKRPFDIRKFCRYAIDSFVLEAAKKDVTLHFDFDDRIPQYLLADYEKLSQVLNNLFSNAIKFTSGGSIRFSIHLLQIEEGHCNVRFEVKDTGIGIKEDRLQTIFNVFNQLSSKITRRHDGMGLGLSISEKLLELMGSTIHVCSKEGEGATFHFDIRLDISAVDKDDDQRFVESHNLEGVKLLLVEDNKLNVLVAKKILNAMQADVDVANNGEEAVAMYKTGSYRVILMDLHMPVMDGFEAAKQIRSIDTKIPILAFTADAFSDARRRAEEAGMNDFITKPFDPATLYNKIRLHIG